MGTNFRGLRTPLILASTVTVVGSVIALVLSASTPLLGWVGPLSAAASGIYLAYAARRSGTFTAWLTSMRSHEPSQEFLDAWEASKQRTRKGKGDDDPKTTTRGASWMVAVVGLGVKWAWRHHRKVVVIAAAVAVVLLAAALSGIAVLSAAASALAMCFALAAAITLVEFLVNSDSPPVRD
jgi:hypothetical protein